jgi:hypothetical protein
LAGSLSAASGPDTEQRSFRGDLMYSFLRSAVLPFSVLFGAALLLGGCSKSATQADQAIEMAKAEQASQGGVDQPTHPDASTPDSAYVALTGKQVLLLTAALSGEPLRYDYLANQIFPDYRATSDTFKKHDMLTMFEPQLDSMITDAKAHPYVAWIDPNSQLEHFDVNQKSFHDLSALFLQIGGGAVSFPDAVGYTVAVTNGPQFQQLHVTDETKARAIEALVGKGPGLQVKIFAYAQGADLQGAPTLRTVITKVQVLDPHGVVLMEQQSQ